MRSNYWLLLTPLLILAFLMYDMHETGNLVTQYGEYYISEGPARKIVNMPTNFDESTGTQRSIAIKQNILDYLPLESQLSVRDIDRVRVYRARSSILENIQQVNYIANRLACSKTEEFFQREITAAQALLELGCLTTVSIPGAGAGRFGDIKVVTTTKYGRYNFNDIGYISCNPAIQEPARQALRDLLESDRLLAEGVMNSEKCRTDESQVNIYYAEDNLLNGDALAAIGNYASAVRKAQSCACES